MPQNRTRASWYRRTKWFQKWDYEHGLYGQPDLTITLPLSCIADRLRWGALAGARKLRGSGRVHCIDPFDASGDSFSAPIYHALQASSTASLRDRFEMNLARADLLDWIEVHQARSANAWSTIPVQVLGHDGSARLVEELVRPPEYAHICLVKSMTFARKRLNGDDHQRAFHE